jgi:hypothetical protein
LGGVQCFFTPVDSLTRTSLQYRLDCMKDVSIAQNASPGRRAATYWFVDGLPEFVLGVSLLAFAAVGLLWQEYTASGSWARLYFLVVAGRVGVLIWKGNAVVDLLKSRLTYPRMGYVPPPRDAEPRSALTILSIWPGPRPNENLRENPYPRTSEGVGA